MYSCIVKDVTSRSKYNMAIMPQMFEELYGPCGKKIVDSSEVSHWTSSFGGHDNVNKARQAKHFNRWLKCESFAILSWMKLLNSLRENLTSYQDFAEKKNCLMAHSLLDCPEISGHAVLMKQS